MKVIGRKRRISAEAERRLREWKPIKELARELGLSESTARFVRRHRFKQAAPQ